MDFLLGLDAIKEAIKSGAINVEWEEIEIPENVEVDKENKCILIMNFYGRKDVIKVPIFGDCEVEIKYQEGSEIPDFVYIKGCDLEAVSQTSGALEQACRLKGKYRKDIRIFYDGIWLWKKTQEEF